jgi:hypothetical protein
MTKEWIKAMSHRKKPYINHGKKSRPLEVAMLAGISANSAKRSNKPKNSIESPKSPVSVPGLAPGS